MMYPGYAAGGKKGGCAGEGGANMLMVASTSLAASQGSSRVSSAGCLGHALPVGTHQASQLLVTRTHSDLHHQ